MDRNSFNWGQERYEDIKKEAIEFVKKIGYKPEKIHFVPLYDWMDNNPMERITKMNWNKVPTLIETINQPEEPASLLKTLFRFPIIDVYKIGDFGTVPVERIKTCIFKPYKIVKFPPLDLTSELKTIK